MFIRGYRWFAIFATVYVPLQLILPTYQSLSLANAPHKKDCTRAHAHVSMETTREMGKTAIESKRTDRQRPEN